MDALELPQDDGASRSMMNPVWPETIVGGHDKVTPQMPINGPLKKENRITFFGRHAGRAGLYARVPTNDQQTLAMQNRVMREYAGRRGWTIGLTRSSARSHPTLVRKGEPSVAIH
jgi:hypothetical protein